MTAKYIKGLLKNKTSTILTVILLFTSSTCVKSELVSQEDFPTKCTDEQCNGENCNSLDECSEKCPNSSQIYDEEQWKCVNLIGENCKLDGDCVPNSICRPEWNTDGGVFNGKCRCGLKYFEHLGNTTCGKRASYGGECHESIQPCETTLFMTCKEGTCQCDSNETQIYDPIKKSCALRIGIDCYNYRTLPWYLPCVQNAECKYFFSKRNPVKCKCAPNYVETSDGFCRANFGQNCNSTSLCHSSGNYVCTDGKCQCDSPMYQVYDKIANKCAGIVGTSCSSQVDCISTAICDESSFKCKCKKSYLETNEHLCELSFEEKCNMTENECNHQKGLACKNGICKCFDSSLVFDEELRYCKVQNGNSHCGIFTNEARNGKPFYAQCDPNMACVKTSTLGRKEVCHCQPLSDDNKITGNFCQLL